MKIHHTLGMSILAATSWLPGVPATARVADAAAVTTAVSAAVNTAAGGMQQQLETSVKELVAVRAVIGDEKIPLAKTISRLEDQLVDARRDYDKARRASGVRSLDLNNLEVGTKALQDEVTYVTSLMDEYARTFEGRLHVSETALYGAVLESALLAPQNKDASPTQKFNQQFALVEASTLRLNQLIGGKRFEGSAVAPDGTIDQGRFALIGPVALFSTTDGRLSGLALAQAGSSKPAVHPLVEKGVDAPLASMVLTGAGMLPFDPTMGGALKALIARGNLWGYFKRGGPIMWPLLALAVLAITVILERLLFLALEKKRRNHTAVAAIMGALEKGRPDDAIRAGQNIKDFVARCLVYALSHRKKSLSDALMRSAAQEMMRYTRGISLLDTVVTMAPLLGLLGTVTGMISAFGMMGGSELGAPTAITGGIAEALIATTFGLGIALTALVPLNFLHARCEGARHEMEDAMSHLELLMKPITDAENTLQQQVTLNGGGK